jgi:hypothetical protein
MLGPERELCREMLGEMAGTHAARWRLCAGAGEPLLKEKGFGTTLLAHL